MRQEFLFVEKYRPQTIDDTILPKGVKKSFKEFVEIKRYQIFYYLVQQVLVKQLLQKHCVMNLVQTLLLSMVLMKVVLIDTLRTKIKNFASTVSLSGGAKVVILDEADYISAESVQPALRNFIEEFSSNCRFIFTCNYKNRIIAPLHSRCTVIDFSIPNNEKRETCICISCKT